MVSLMQVALNKVRRWGDEHGLTFSLAKTVAVVFSLGRKGSKDFPPLKFGGQEIQYSNSVKYLGVTLDSKLTFKEHLLDKCKSATRLLMGARTIMSKLTGVSPSAARWIYQSMVRPIVLYGAIVWAHKVPPSFKPFIRLQRLAMLGTGSYLKSTPTLGLEVTLNYTPLDILAKMEAFKASARISERNLSQWDGIGFGSRRGHLYLSSRDWGNIDRMPTTYQWEGRPILDRFSLLTGKPMPVPGTVIFTDGSQMTEEDLPGGNQTNFPTKRGNVGFGFIIKDQTDRETTQWGNLGPNATVFQGEVFAIQKAAEWLLEEETTDEAHFYIDSTSAIKAVTGIECNSKTVMNCKEAISKLVSRRDGVYFHWVRAHVGHELNEKADRAAKFGTSSGWTYTVPRHGATLKPLFFKKQWTRGQSGGQLTLHVAKPGLCCPQLTPDYPNFYFSKQDRS